jgi:hypothetical protein
MSKCFLFAALLLLGLAFAGTAEAADPPKEGTLPAPKPLPEIPGYGQLRINRYAVWQYYDVDRFGRFRPVVVNSPYGAYYLFNGERFPWATVHYLEVMPKIVD